MCRYLKHSFWTEFFHLASQSNEEIEAEQTTEWPVLVEFNLEVFCDADCVGFCC